MKNIRLIYFVLAGLMLLVSCNKEEIGPVLDEMTAAVLTVPADGTSLVFSEDNAAEMLDFAWTAADYGFQAAVTYTVEVAQAGTDFAEVTELFNTNENSGSISYGSINNMLLAGGAAGGASLDFEIRVVSMISPAVADLVSNVNTATVTTYMVEVSYPMLYVPGNYQEWDPSNTTTVIYSVESDQMYEGYIYFTEAATEFKFTEQPNWDVNWGDDGADGTLEADGANIAAAGPAQYKLNVDLAGKTYTAVMTDWGIIGTATTGDWDSDQNMTFDVDNNIWTITTDLAAGEMKFRANDDWTINLGDDDANGFMEYDGANIAVAEAGNYTIVLDLSQALYTYKLTKN